MALLSYGVMAASAGEAVEGALTEGLPGAEVLAQLSRRLRGLPPQDLPPTSDPVWGLRSNAPATGQIGCSTSP
jgi:hypothetical protein